MPARISTHVCEVRPRKDHRGVDLVSYALPFGGCGMAGRMQLATPSIKRSSAVHCRFVSCLQRASNFGTLVKSVNERRLNT
jgi:hypothetical protein